MKTKNLLLTLTGILFLLHAEKASASHIIGNSITYEYVGTNQYLLTMKLYRDCSGIPAPPQADICYSSASAGLNGTVILNPVAGTGLECQPSPCVAGNGISACIGGSNFSMQEWIYQGVVTLPQAAFDWILSFEQCCRNAAITTLGGAAGTGAYVYTKLDNLNYPVNSSPQFTTPPFAQYCLNVLSTYSFTSIDPDGDSLVYSLAGVEDASFGCPMTGFALGYNAPYSATNPLSSSTALAFDPATGNLTFTPDIMQIAVIGMIVQEYRNGVLIGEVKRDDEISIVNGIMYSNYMKGKVYIDNNSNQVYDAGDDAMHGSIIEAQPGPLYSSTNFFGDYAQAVQFGTFTTTIPNIPLYYVVTPASNTATFSMSFQTDSLNDFILSAPYNAQDLRVVLTGNPHCAPGSGATLHITYVNVGTAPISGSVNLVYDMNFNYINSSVTPDNIAGNTITWNFSNLPTLASADIDVFFMLPLSVQLNTQILSYADILPLAGDSFPQDNSDTLHQLAAAPVDPNEKTVEPSGFITTGQIAGGLYLEYTIFFQNTGNAPAIDVVIADTLHPNLNIPTFEVLSASHPYTWSIRDHGIIEFRFDNIYLPDSNANEPLSHGFIKYRIKPKNNLVTGDKMTNTAYIVFDSNAPVVTNSTSTTVIHIVSVNELSPDVSDLLIYPNPSNNFLTIEMNLKEAAALNILLLNVTGQTIMKTESNVKPGIFKKQLEINDLSEGIYFLKIETSKGVNVVKIIKN
ncbi:MAG TPA: T9SS type A sorting domain-containing protein [Bacteroidia bacterium]|nr:T9SS type A sorting domain-containing protein [Bacteroidia bacterium]